MKFRIKSNVAFSILYSFSRLDFCQSLSTHMSCQMFNKERESKRLIINTGDLSDVDGFFALSEYAKGGTDVLFVMNYPAYVGVDTDEDDYARQHLGLGFKYGAKKILERDANCTSIKYHQLLSRYANNLGTRGAVDANLIMKSALTDLAFALCVQIWQESKARGQFLFAIGGVNSINPFSHTAVKNEALVYADLITDPMTLPRLPLHEHAVFDKHAQPFSLSLGRYDEVYLDFCGSCAFFDDHWEQKLGETSNAPCGAYIMGGVRSSKPAATLSAIEGVLNRLSPATLNQLYHPVGTTRFLRLLRDRRVPTYIVTTDQVQDLAKLPAAAKVGPDEVLRRFLQANRLGGAMLERLARAYYGAAHHPAQKPFDLYAARALARHARRGAAALPSPEKLRTGMLHFAEGCGAALVSERERGWAGARDEFLAAAAGLAEDGARAAARAREAEVLGAVGSADVSLEVGLLSFALDGETGLLRVDDGFSAEESVEA